ncbi:AAA domain-containing protein [Paucibacter sp. APW11]|uniref:AAA domain-containing protein n=1 Tax=Roseateles aquae TaxID=3077235 RepID=A0ABU3PA91_9BURK|nr:AAA domain-containing protein [Paucibacter sp. APW11]MDT8999499.1 AAA domain-containing protein [Paucibacter sp. APW11]
MSLTELRAAVEAELAATPEYYDFKVLRREREGELWRVTLHSDYVFAQGQRPGQGAQALLDDSLDGASAWWGAPERGGAQVLAVLVEQDQLLLEQASSAPPGPDQLIRLYPPRFLQPLADAAWDTPWAERALALRPALSRAEPLPGAPPLSGAPFRWLRAGQRQALGLVGQRCAYLWGPPGTGKTTTLGVLLAEYLEQRPQARVLLIASTHTAVDLATLAVDKALEKGRREAFRATVQRLGSRFDAQAYAGREHLIPRGDAALITQLARHEAQRPSASDAQRLQAWRERLRQLREASRASALQVLRQARLVSMTAARACFTLKTLRELSAEADEPFFDLLVIDEASQLSLAQALLLMPLARAWLFAGDPEQLAPVQRSEDALARRWLGRSAFADMPRGAAPSVVMLDEQSRMAPAICELVSEVFYEGRLRVADEALQSASWAQARARALGDIDAHTPLQIMPVQRDGGWVAEARGPLRRESAEAIATLLRAALDSGQWQAGEIIVLTPFRAQRALIRRCLAEQGIDDSLRVSTVHKAQGSEAALVLFDPVDGRQPFLQNEAARRLINVAWSRAQAKLLVFLSAGDVACPWLAPLLARQRLAGDARPVLPLQQLAAAKDFPANAMGQRVAAGRHIGEVCRVSPDGRQLWLLNERSGATQLIDAEFWRARAASGTVA